MRITVQAGIQGWWVSWTGRGPDVLAPKYAQNEHMGAGGFDADLASLWPDDPKYAGFPVGGRRGDATAFRGRAPLRRPASAIAGMERAGGARDGPALCPHREGRALR